MEKDSPCEIVSEYIICECGDNFPSEEKLRIHLINDHGQKLEKPKPQQKARPTPPPPLQKKVVVVEEPQDYCITSEPLPQQDSAPQLLIFAGRGKPKPIKITRPLYILRTEDIKQEIVFENMNEEIYTPITFITEPDSGCEVTVKEETDSGQFHSSNQIELKQEIVEPKDEGDDKQMSLLYEEDGTKSHSQVYTFEVQEEAAEIQGKQRKKHKNKQKQEKKQKEEECEKEGQLEVEAVYEEQSEEQQGDIEYEEIQYEEIPYDSEVTGDAVSYETVATAAADHFLSEHNYGVGESAQEFFCDVCGKSFPYEKSVNLHKRVHRPKGWVPPEGAAIKRNKNYKNVVCDVCGKKYASPAQLRYHQRIHTGEKPYGCQFCEKRFTMPLFMQVHVRTHTGERPYQCPLCPKAFTNRAALLRHERVHTGVKPYACPECGKCFSQSNSMKLHVRTVHMKLPAPYKSKARKLREQQRKEAQALSMQQQQRVEQSKVVFDDDECILYDGDGGERVVIALRSVR